MVIDDCSPEKELSRWLDGLAADNAIELLRNERNRGFVASVNRGMARAGSRDVVLLNSDAEVPKEWLGRLAAHAYSHSKIGTVTPFSNNATICSYPAPPGGPLVPGRSIDEIDTACRRANAGRAVEIPTAVGFCMYIRNDCLQATGLFDEDAFGRGYGEENDFCVRASKAGWVHLLACDTFVYHAGEVSFGPNSPGKEKSWRILIERHPDYPRLVAEHVSRDPAAAYRFAATAALFRAAPEPTILFIGHRLGGGTEQHFLELAGKINGSANVLLLKPGEIGLELSVLTIQNHPILRLAEEDVEPLAAILRSFGVERIHVHHTIGFGKNLREIIRKLEVPFDLTIHDYFLICPQINLLQDVNASYCRKPDPAGCNACIARRPSHNAHNITEWRHSNAWLLEESERVFCPSKDVYSRVIRYAPSSRALVVPHEVVDSESWPLKVPHLGKRKRLRIAVLGVLAPHKGRDIVLACVEAADPELYEFIIIGNCHPKMPGHLRKRIRETGPIRTIICLRYLRAFNRMFSGFLRFGLKPIATPSAGLSRPGWLSPLPASVPSLNALKGGPWLGLSKTMRLFSRGSPRLPASAKRF